MNIRILLPTLLLVLFNISCKKETKRKVKKEIQKEGFVTVKGGKLWYKIVGEGKGTPLLILHGGPGSRSCSMIPGYSGLGNDRPIVFYDQLGSGNSDRPKDSTLWKINTFAEHLDVLRDSLQLKEVHILGQSFGGSLLIEYLATRNPKGVKSAIFSSPLISTPMWIEDAKLLLSQMPSNLQDTIKKYELLKQYDNPEYRIATDSFYKRHLTRKRGPRKKIAECETADGFNSDIYNYMWGPTEFTATGTLKDFDRTSDLKNINIPILFIAGEYDEARPETMYKFQKMTKNAGVEIIENAAHATASDNPEKVTEILRDFLNSTEK